MGDWDTVEDTATAGIAITMRFMLRAASGKATEGMNRWAGAAAVAEVTEGAGGGHSGGGGGGGGGGGHR